MDIDTAGAQKVLGMVQNTQLETGDFADAMQNAYLDGYTGVEFDRINRSSLAGQLTQEQRSLAWEAGRQARAAQIGSMAQTVGSGKMATAKGGLKIADNVDLSNLNQAQESALSFIRAISESGVPVEVYASTEAERAAGAANGSFSPDGSIRIDINAGDNGQGAAAYALAHEITHFTEIYSPEKFQNLADLLIREAGENGIAWENMLEAKTAQLREQKQYAGLEEQKLADLARSECIAEMCETILTDTDAAARLSRKLQAQDKGLWEKIKDFFTGLVEKLKEAYLDWKEVIAPSGFFTPDTYDNYLTGVGNVHGEDLNGDGKTDKYSKTKAMARYINSLPLTNEQKDFLFALAYPNIDTQKKYKLW